MAERFELPTSLARAVLERLGVAAPTDRASLTALYVAWADAVPFTNMSKALAASRGEPSPEADGAALCERWLDTGVGGTCWGHVAAFAGLCTHGGLRTQATLERALWRAAGEVDFHGAVLVWVDDRALLCDLVHVVDEPLELVAGAHGANGPYRAGLRAHEDGSLEHWFEHPSRDDVAVYRVLSTNIAPGDVAALVRIAERFTGVPVDRVMWRRCPPGELVSVRSVPTEPTGDPYASDGLADEPGIVELRRWTASGLVEQRRGRPAELFAAAGALDPGECARIADRLAGLA